MLSCRPGNEITVINPGEFDRSEVAEVASDQLQPLPSGKAYIVMTKQGEVLPSQLSYDGKLLIFVDLKAKETVTYTVKTGAPKSYPARTYGRYIKERKDDFAWENDRVAFRIYGQALLPIDGPSNGLDLWYKRTSDTIINKFYRDELAGKWSYHDDHGEGMDDYKVGCTLGGGMMAPFVNESLVLNENYVGQELLENGPLRTSFRLAYKDITVGDRTFAESRIFSLDAGSQLTKVTQIYGVKDTLTVAAGIIKRSDDDDAMSAYSEKGTAAIIYEEPETKKAGKVFVGMVFPNGLERVITNTYTITHAISKKEESHSHVLGVTTYLPDQPVTYYTGFGWDKFGFDNINDFQRYIGNFVKKIEEPLIIKIL